MVPDNLKTGVIKPRMRQVWGFMIVLTCSRRGRASEELEGQDVGLG